MNPRLPNGVATIAMVLLLASCSGRDTFPTVPTENASMVGRVTRLDRSGERIGRVLVEEDSTRRSGWGKASVQVTQGTTVVALDGRRADYNALSEGQWVRVWFTGPVAESYPVKAAAGTVLIDSVVR